MRHPLGHPLEPLFEHAAESLTTALSPSSLEAHRTALRSFLRYLGAQHHDVCRLEQLRRDPHILGWLTELRSHHPAREHPRHQIPRPQALRSSATSRADLPSLLNSLDTARYVLEMFRRTVSEHDVRRLLDRIGNRLTKMLAELRRTDPAA
jgi:hypothetical protein